MAVQQSCRIDTGTVIVRVSDGEFLEYRVPAASEGVEYRVVANDESVIVSNADCPPPCVRRWPAPGASVPRGTVFHTLVVQFFADESLEYEVDRKDSAECVIEEVLRCRYENRGGADEHFDPLEILVR
jgi:hypothetical protein